MSARHRREPTDRPRAARSASALAPGAWQLVGWSAIAALGGAFALVATGQDPLLAALAAVSLVALVLIAVALISPRRVRQPPQTPPTPTPPPTRPPQPHPADDDPDRPETAP